MLCVFVFTYLKQIVKIKNFSHHINLGKALK